LELDQQYDQTYLVRGQIARLKGDLAEAQKNYDKVLELSAGNLDAIGSSLDILLQQQNYTEAERLVTDFLQKDPSSLPMLRTLARNIYYPQNRFEEAIATMQQVLALAPNDPNRWDDLYAIAVMLVQSGRLQEALPMAQQALELAPPNQKEKIQPLVNQLQAQLGVGTPPTNTLPVVAPAPQP
jgi:tetratricopeptide (TPR) repeat protein